MVLTDEEKLIAEKLGLTYTEMHVALATHVAPERYAEHKREIRARREAWERKLTAFADYAEKNSNR